MKKVVSAQIIQQQIYMIRGQKVMLSLQLAKLYQVEVRSLIQAVKRNKDRFPRDFMFQLTLKESDNLKSQFVISSWGGSRRATPYAFTEQGVAMLSSILNSKRAIQVNIQIMHVFVRIKNFMASHGDLARKIERLERKFKEHDKRFVIVFDAIRQLMEIKPEKPKNRIGFHP